MSCYIGQDAQRATHWPPSHALGSHPPPVLLRVGTAAVMVAAVAAVLAHRFSSSFVSAFDTVGHNSMNERASASCMCSVESFLSRTSSSKPMPSLLIFMDMILLVSCLVFCSHSEVPCAHLSFLPSFLPSSFLYSHHSLPCFICYCSRSIFLLLAIVLSVFQGKYVHV